MNDLIRELSTDQSAQDSSVRARIATQSERIDSLAQRVNDQESSRTELERLLQEARSLSDRLGRIESEVSAIEVQATKATTSAEFAERMLTVAAGIAGFFAIVLAWMFSHRFVSLHEDNAVSKAILERVEKALEKSEGNPAG